jgi:peptide chain release factor 2
MRAETETMAGEIRASWRCCGGIFDWDRALKRLDELNAKAEDPNLWNDRAAAQKVTQSAPISTAPSRAIARSSRSWMTH